MNYSTNLLAKDDIKIKLASLAYHIESNPNLWTNLSKGDLGKILYYFYVSYFTSNETYASQGKELLTKVIHAINTRKDSQIMNPSLGSGIAGLGITLEVLVNEGFLVDDFDEYLKSIDQFVFEGSLKCIKNGDTDFLHGGTGGFHYLYYRLGRNAQVRQYLIEFVYALDQITVKRSDTVYFPNKFKCFTGEPNEVNMGLSHGMVAITLILINLFEANIEPDITSRLIRQSVNFILQYYNADHYEKGINYHFPSIIILEDNKYSERNLKAYKSGLRWCYGDLNVAHLLYKASKALQVQEWLEMAHHTGLSTLAVRNIDQAHCHGGFFCHGASGIAYYYKYLARISGKQSYREGYDFWIEKTLELYETEVKQKNLTSKAGEFLEGFVGSSLVLMSDLQPQASYWEKIWLLC